MWQSRGVFMTLQSFQVAGVWWSAILRLAAYETINNGITVSGNLSPTIP